MAEEAKLDEEDLRRAMELLFYAYRDFTGEADAILAEYGFGRAHHRVIYFVGRNPGITVNELLAILKITKQSLSRVLGQLLREGYIAQREDAEDRRRRRHTLTEAGRALEAQLTARQGQHVAAAFRAAGVGGAEGFQKVLRALINPEDRARIPEEQQDIIG